MKNSVVIIPKDNLVISDGIQAVMDINVSSNINSIQWTNNKGEIEYNDGTSNIFFDVSEYKKYVKPYVTMLEDKISRDSEAQEAKFSSLEYRWSTLRRERDTRLKKTDFMLMPDYTIDSELKNEVIKYRQELRDITELDGAPWTPETIPWPTNPVE